MQEGRVSYIGIAKCQSFFGIEIAQFGQRVIPDSLTPAHLTILSEALCPDFGMKNVSNFFKRSCFAAFLFAAGFLLAPTGCQTADKTSPASFASVVITGNTPGQIGEAAVDVFAHRGYSVMKTDPANLVFEKKAGGMSDLAYGDWIGDAVWVRVKASVVPLGDMKWRLQCRAYLLRDRGSALEEEISVSKLHRGQYQKLLDEVAARFRTKQ